MKYYSYKTARHPAISTFLMIVAIGVLTASAKAQTGSVFETEIPFDFVIKNKTYSAGTYSIGRFSLTNPDVLILKNAAGKIESILQTQRLGAGEPNRQSALTFYRYGDVYFLDSIWTFGKNYGSRLTVFKANRERRDPVLISKIVTLRGKNRPSRAERVKH